MRVKKQPGKKLQPSPAEVTQFVADCLGTPETSRLASLLAGTLSRPWSFPKSDLFHWVPLLDRLDELLAQIIETHWSSETLLQSHPFDEATRILVVSMLVFSRLLLENCSSRNIFCSYDRLKKLLVSDDFAILEAVLELLLIPARKLDSQMSLRVTFEREVGTDELVTLAQLSLPFLPEMGELEEAKFALRFREHHEQRLAQLPESLAPRLHYVKLLATAIYLMAQPDGSVDSAFFAVSPTLVSDTAKLVSAVPEGDMKLPLAALSILRSCIKSSNKWSEVIYNLNMYVGHGPIVSIYRTMGDAMQAQQDIPYPPMFVFAYLDFLSVLATQVEMDESFTNSGFITEMVRAISAAHAEYYKIMEKTLYVLDALIHQYSSSLDSFFSVNGLQSVVKNISHLIEARNLSHADSVILQCHLRFIDKLLASHGSDDRLRNLLESSLFKSLTLLFSESFSFSVEVITHAISITSTFIHNEPTSLSFLQEVRTPQALLSCIKEKIPTSADALSKIPYAFSAICLNASGAELFAQVDPVVTLCQCFLDLDFLKLLRTRSTASSLGTAMDEFIRHHPQFRPMVIEDLIQAIRKIPQVVSAFKQSGLHQDLFIGCELLEASSTLQSEKRMEPVLSQILETLCSFIEGLVQSPSHARQFMDADGVTALMGAFYAPGVSFDFTVYNESLSISHMLRVLSDVDGEHVISAVLRSWVVQASEMDSFLSDRRSESYFAAVLLSLPVSLTQENHIFNMLTSSLAVVGLLRDLYVTHSFTFSRVGGPLVKGFTTAEGQAAVVLLSILLKVASWEFGLLLHSLNEATVAAIFAKAKTDFKAAVFVTFASAIAQLSIGRDLQLLGETELKEKGENVDDRTVRNILYISFTLQRLMTNISAIFSGLSKMIASRTLVIEAITLTKLCEEVANCGINALSWIQIDAKDAPLDLKSFLIVHVMQLLPVLLFDEAGNRSASLMESVLDAFVNLKGPNDLTKTIQDFMIAGLAAGDEPPKNFLFALKEIVGFFSKIANPQLKISGSRVSIDHLRDMVCLFCVEFCQLPLTFRKNLSTEVLSQILVCFANLVELGHDWEISADEVLGNMPKRPLSQFQDDVRERFPQICIEFSSCSSDLAVELAALMKALINFRPQSLDQMDDLPDSDDEYQYILLHENHTDQMYCIEPIYNWVLAADCPLPLAIRFRVLAGALNCKQRKYLYERYYAALPEILQRLKNDGIEQKNHEIVANGVLLIAEIVYLSTLPKVPPYNSEIFEHFADNISSAILEELCHLSIVVLHGGQESIDVTLSAMYLIAALTRLHETHKHFDVKLLVKDLIQRPIMCLSTPDKRYQAIPIISHVIIRHLIETREYLNVLMQTEIKLINPTAFASGTKIKSFVSSGNMEHLLCRNFASFREAIGKHYALDLGITELAELEEDTLIVSKKSIKDANILLPDFPSLESLEDLSLSPSASPMMDTLITCLIQETLFPSSESAEANEKSEGDGQILMAHFRRCHILVAIVELIHSYPVCRKQFLQHPKRDEFILFLLEKMTSCGELAGTLGSRVFVNEPMWVSQLLDTICAGPSQLSLEDKIESIPMTVEIVVDALERVLERFIADCGSSIDTYSKMSKAWCLIMTAFVLLSLKGSNSARSVNQVQAAVAARMLERDFVALFSKILGAIDSRAPMAPLLAAKIVFSLEILAKLSQKLTRMVNGKSVGVSLLEDSVSVSDGFDNMDSEMSFEDMDTASQDSEDSMDEEETDDDDMLMDVDGSSVGLNSDETSDSQTEFSDEDDDTMMDMTDEDSDEYSDEDDHFHLIVHPPTAPRSGPAADALSSGFQVLPIESFHGAEYGQRDMQAYMEQPFDIEMVEDDDEEDDEDEYFSDASIGDDEDEDDGFSVEGEYEDSEEALFNDRMVMPMRDAQGRLNRNNFPRRLLGQSYASQARDQEVFGHPLLNGRADVRPPLRQYGFEAHRLQPSSVPVPPSRVQERTWSTNQEVFHNPFIVGTWKRWSQESKMFIGDDVQTVAIEAIPLLFEEMRVEAEAWRDARLQQRKAEEPTTRPVEIPQQVTPTAPDETPEATSPSTAIPSVEAPVYEDPGPDTGFLEALPFEMRREVLQQYFEERRGLIPDGARVCINPTFLSSLPRDLRDDYERLSQQEIERFNRRRGVTSIPGLDFSAILERLDTDLRQSLAQIYENVAVEMGELNADGPQLQIDIPAVSDGAQVSNILAAIGESVRRMRDANSSAPPTLTPKKVQAILPIPKKDYENMVDVKSLATILRLFYNPTMTENRTHMKLFQHLCAGKSVRTDLLNMLIYILEEMPENIAKLDAVLNCYVAASDPSASSKKAASGKATPKKKTPGKNEVTNEPFGGSSYVVIQQRTFQILLQLIQHNDEVRKFFTACQSSPWKISRVDKKGDKSGGGKQVVTSTNYPIVLLLACFGRQTFIQVPLLVENLLHILQLVTTPLKDKQQQSTDPEVPAPFVSVLVKTIVNCELSPKGFNYATQTFQNLGCLESIASIILSELSEVTIKQVELCVKDIEELVHTLNLQDKESINTSLKRVSQSSSYQMRLLRGMKMLSSTVLKPLRADEERNQVFDTLLSPNVAAINDVVNNAKNGCWGSLLSVINECLLRIGGEGELLHVATGLLPAIEAYFWHVRQAAVLTPVVRESEEERVFSFADRHRVILNTMIRGNPSLLTSGPFLLLTKMPKALDFDNKRAWFKQQLSKRGASRQSLSIHVRRAHIFEDSFHAIMSRSGEEVKCGKLSIKFHDEEGLDAGGVTREWFSVLSRQMFDPNYALFKVSAVDKITYQPNRMSYINPDHLQYFAFIGRIIGKAIYESRLLDCYFTRSFYKHILSIPVDFKDLETIDPEFFKSLSWILNNDSTEVMDLTFTVESEEFGVVKVIDLKPDGSNIPVTEANKKEYVKLVAEHKLSTEIKPQIDAFLRGFHEIVPASLISIFNEQELELLISGMPDIDVDDWKNTTTYTGYTVASPQIHWFWRVVRSFDQEYRAKLLQFATGTSKVPLDGFAALQGSTGIQRFQIHRDYGAKDRLPSAHTCFNQLDLPEYETYEQLRDMLNKAINECGSGFGLV